MTFIRQATGKIGESIASDYLKKQGFSILHLNYRTLYGEIDIVGKKDNKIHFIEVKTRTSLKNGYPHEAVHYYKRQHLEKAVRYYILKNRVKDYKLSVDVISILMENGSVKEFKHFTGIDINH